MKKPNFFFKFLIIIIQVHNLAHPQKLYLHISMLLLYHGIGFYSAFQIKVSKWVKLAPHILNSFISKWAKSLPNQLVHKKMLWIATSDFNFCIFGQQKEHFDPLLEQYKVVYGTLFLLNLEVFKTCEWVESLLTLKRIFSAGRYDIARALEKWGGLHEVSRLLSLKVRHPNRMRNNVNDGEKAPSKQDVSLDTEKWMVKLKDVDINWVD